MRVGLVFDDAFLRHDTGVGHPERPARLRAIRDRLEADGVRDQLARLPFGPASRDVLERLHTSAYIDRLMFACQHGERYIDVPDSMICVDSEAIARQAVGGVLAACDAVMAGEVGRVFCAVRPPGHHAEADRSMGFCLYANAALAADHLVRVNGLERVAVVDFDVHHGNGTQHLLETRRDILFVSVHEDPRTQYPGTGFAHERGVGGGEGFTVNAPVATGTGDDGWRAAFEREVWPALERFAPEAMVVSAGFDAAAADPIGGLRLSTASFAWVSERLVRLADRFAEGRLVSVLEGGYDLDALAAGVSTHVAALMSG